MRNSKLKVKKKESYQADGVVYKMINQYFLKPQLSPVEKIQWYKESFLNSQKKM